MTQSTVWFISNDTGPGVVVVSQLVSQLHGIHLLSLGLSIRVLFSNQHAEYVFSLNFGCRSNHFTACVTYLLPISCTDKVRM